MRKILLVLLLTLAARGQQTFTTAPTGGRRFEVKEVLGTQGITTVGSRVCGGHSATVVRASASTLTLWSGAAAATPQYILFPTLTQPATASSTLTLSGAGTNAGTVWVWAVASGTTVTIKAGSNISGVTLSCAGGLGCSQQAGVISGFPTGTVVPIWAWSVTAGAFDASNTASGDAGLAKDCWVDSLAFTNSSVAAATVTVQDGLGTPNPFLSVVSVPANSTSLINLPGGMVFRGGLFWNAGTASAITGYARFVRQTGPVTAP